MHKLITGESGLVPMYKCTSYLMLQDIYPGKGHIITDHLLLNVLFCVLPCCATICSTLDEIWSFLILLMHNGFFGQTRERTPPEVRAAREREREMRELERDTRTIFAYNLNLKAEDRDIYEFFSKAGKVIDVKIIMDRNTRKSKGFAYVEFENQVHYF